MTRGTILVTGATGKTGARIAKLLEDRGVPVKRASRRAEAGFDWEKPASYAAALRGCRTVYLCYYPDYAFPGTTATLTAFCEVAKQSGVEHIVMLAGRGETHAQRAEETVRCSGIPTTALRSAWFAQNFSEGALLPGVREGVIAMPGGGVREPVIDLDDLCEIASRMLVAAPGNRSLDLTGPESLTFAEKTMAISREIRRPLRYRAISFDEFQAGLSAAAGAAYARIVTDIARETFDGRNEGTTDDVERILGRKPRSFSKFARTAAANGAWTTHPSSQEGVASNETPQV